MRLPKRENVAKGALLLPLPLYLGVKVWRLAEIRNRANTPALEIIVPKTADIGQTAAALAFSPDSQTLAVADTQTGQIQLLDLNKSKFTARFDHFSNDTVRTLAWHKRGVLALGTNGVIRVLKVPTGKLRLSIPNGWERKPYQYQMDHYAQPAIAADAEVAALGQVHGAVTVYDTRTGKRRYGFKAPMRETYGLALSRDGQSLAVGSVLLTTKPPDKTMPYRKDTFEIAFRDARTGTLRKSLRWDEVHKVGSANIGGHLGEMGLAFSPDGKVLANATATGLALYDVPRAVLLRKIGFSPRKHFSRYSDGKWAAFSPDGTMVAAIGWENLVFVWSVTTGQLLQTFHGAAGGSTLFAYQSSLAFSPDGKHLAVGGQIDYGRGHIPGGSGNGFVDLWNVENLH